MNLYRFLALVMILCAPVAAVADEQVVGTLEELDVKAGLLRVANEKRTVFRFTVVAATKYMQGVEAVAAADLKRGSKVTVVYDAKTRRVISVALPAKPPPPPPPDPSVVAQRQVDARLVKFTYPYDQLKTGQIGTFPPDSETDFRIVTVYKEKGDVIVKERRSQVLLLRKVDTTDLVDGKRIGLSGSTDRLWRVLGTEKVGITTLFVVEPESYKKLVNEELRKAKAER